MNQITSASVYKATSVERTKQIPTNVFIMSESCLKFVLINSGSFFTGNFDKHASSPWHERRQESALMVCRGELFVKHR